VSSEGDNRGKAGGKQRREKRDRPGMGRQDRRERSGSPSRGFDKPPLDLFTTTLWQYPSQHYDAWIEDGQVKRSSGRQQGDKQYVGATPSWIIWQLLMRYTRRNDLVVDPMCGSGTTLDVSRDLGRRGIGYDLEPSRDDIFRADARKLPLENASADFVFVDPPYSTHVDYSDSPDCIGKLDAGGDDAGEAYYKAMGRVIEEINRVLKPRRYMALYVSDSWKKRSNAPAFMSIGFELFSIMRHHFEPVDIISVVRHNTKLKRGNWHKAAQEGNFFLRGFNYLFVMKKPAGTRPLLSRADQ
jgi:adenine-specific DNA-methyltransferase